MIRLEFDTIGQAVDNYQQRGFTPVHTDGGHPTEVRMERYSQGIHAGDYEVVTIYRDGPKIRVDREFI